MNSKEEVSVYISMAEDNIRVGTPRTLLEVDYLLAVNDEARQGALRFSVKPNASMFLASKDQTAIPPILDLAKLLSATERFLADNGTPRTNVRGTIYCPTPPSAPPRHPSVSWGSIAS